ncbi:MAG: arabinogalactan endo-1,4-beta-galactosidase [Ginsengibacter sp.]
MKYFIIGVILIVLINSCNKSATTSQHIPPVVTLDIAKGADISWLTEMENNGIIFKDRSGNTGECITILKNLGLNAVRLRVWVNPADGYCNTTDVLNKAKRANSLGMKIMLDFHLSDSWADPGQQNKPAAWLNKDANALQSLISEHISNTLNTLKASGISPAWVQIGNETNDGCIWPDGKASTNMAGFAKFINVGYTAVKAIFPDCKIIVHLSNGYDNSLYRWLFDGLKSNNANWDIIGMSLYPTAGNYDVLNNQCLANMNDMIARYNKEIMICEVGMPVSDSNACNLFLKDLVTKVKSLPNSKGLGIFYWEPEAFKSWKGYKLGAFNDSGLPSNSLLGLTQ